MPIFATTRWSVVLAATGADSAVAGAALEALCRTYWYPVYALARREGCEPADAEDLTQSFFLRLIEKGQLQVADRERGRFRTFLRVAFRRYRINEWQRSVRLKRGGGQEPVPWDAGEGERRFQGEPVDDRSPDRIYERRWALTLLESALTRLRGDEAEAGRGREFEILKEYLAVERGAIPYARLAAELGVAEGAARVAVHRFRKRYRECFRAAVADTVGDPAEVDEELRYVVGILGEG